ncbi:MAG: hypothetical protein BA864_15690 [Desulfuromonadales bacterium C00003093]|nr:MAG: hypothetical protein BA864_15690 [Desulfuromonadales bacterium C00003093]
MEELRLVSISFHTAGKVFDFAAGDHELKIGDKVVVETERGRALGVVIREPRMIDPQEAPPKLKNVLRIADKTDLKMGEDNARHEGEALEFCHQRVQERKMEMKLVRAEYLFDGSKIIFYFTADGRVDFRELVRDLAQHFRTRIEMRQIGVRDEAKMVGGIGVCGRELCCSSHLRNFAPVSVKMAKAQGLALNPAKISGQCGRLLCCLAYEYETYNELRKNLPKCGKKIQLESGPAEVIALDVLAQKMTVCCADGERCQVHLEDLKKGFDKRTPERAKSKVKTEQQPAAVKTNKPADSSEQKTERRSNRRPDSRNRRPKSTQQQQQQQNKSGPGPEPEPAPGEKQEDSKARRRRRRPRNRPNRPKQPENNS